MKKFFLLLIGIFISMQSFAQSNSLYQKKTFIREGDTLRYRILYPLNYDQKKKYPLVVFFMEKENGAGIMKCSFFMATACSLIR